MQLFLNWNRFAPLPIPRFRLQLHKSNGREFSELESIRLQFLGFIRNCMN